MQLNNSCNSVAALLQQQRQVQFKEEGSTQRAQPTHKQAGMQATTQKRCPVRQQPRPCQDM
jgi:hypothetical protein